MNLLDLYEGREPHQQAIDRLEQRRIEDLEARMDDCARRGDKEGFQKCKDERDSYYKVKTNEGSMKHMMHKDAERMSREKFCDTYGDEHGEFWDNINGPLDEAGIGQDIADKKEKIARATPQTRAGTVASTVKNAAKWLAGKGGPGREGPTYEGADDVEDRGEYDREGDMAKDNIHTIVRNARELESVISDNDNLPEWVQDKLANIKGMMTAVSEYMQTQDERDQEGEVAIAEKLKGLPSKKLGSARDLGKSVRKFRSQRGLEEAGTDSQWSKESNWKAIPKAKSGRPVDPRGEVTHLSDVARREAERKANQKKNSEKINEYISMGSDKNYMEAEPYKNYKIYVRKKPFGNTGIYTAHTEIDRKEFMGKGPSQEEAVQAIRDRIDFVLNAQKKVTGSSTIDFNVKFATDLLADPRQTFYAKLENVKGQPKLIIAGTDIANDPELLAAGDFKRSALRNQVDDQGRATPLPGIPLTAKSLRAGDWIANGRYTVGNETTDGDGNRIFDLTYHSTAHTKSDKLRLNQPAFTLGTAREVDEGWQDFNKVEPYAVCLAGKPVKKFDYYEDARRFHDNWKQKLYREGEQAKADKITLMPLNLDEGDDLGNLDAEVFGRIDKEKQRRADLKKNDPAAYAKEMEKDSKNYGRGIMGALRRKYDQPLDEAMNKNDLLGNVAKDLNTQFKKAKSGKLKASGDFTKGDHWQGAKPGDYGYTGYQGHGMPKDNPKKNQVKEFAPGGTMKPPAPPTAKKKDPFEDDDRSQLLMSIKNLLDKGAKIDSYLFGARGHITGVANDYFGFYFKKLNKPHSKSSFVRPMDGQDDESYMLKLVKPGYYQLWDKSIANAGEQGVAEGIVDTIRSKNYARLADRSAGKRATALDNFDEPEHQKQTDIMKQRNLKSRLLNKEQGVAEGTGPQSKLDQKIIHLLTNGIPADAIARKLDIPVAWVDEVAEYNMPDSAIDYNDPRNTPPTNRFGEGQTDYQKRRQRERDVDAGKPVTKQRQPKQTDYQKRRAQDKKDMELGEEKTRLDPKCWTGKKIGTPKTKMKGGVRVNNCVPAEESYTGVMESQGVTDPKFLEVARKIDLFAKTVK